MSCVKIVARCTIGVRRVENVAYYNDEVNIIFFQFRFYDFWPEAAKFQKQFFNGDFFLLMSIFVFDQKKSGLDVPSSIMWSRNGAFGD